MEKNKIIAARINCSKQIVWREPNRTVCLVLVSLLSIDKKHFKNKTVKFVLTLS